MNDKKTTGSDQRDRVKRKSTMDERLARLRQSAERELARHPDSAPDLPAGDVQQMLDDVRVYQAELEIQNEELRETQVALERSLERFTLLFQRAPVGYVVLDRSGMVVNTNGTMADMLGTDPADLERKPFERVIAEEDRGEYYARLASFFKHPDEKSMELRLAPRNASPFYVKIQGRTQMLGAAPADRIDEDRLLLVVTNVDERHRAQAALAESERRYRGIVNTAPVGIFQSTPSGRYRMANPQFAHMLGFDTLEEMLEAVEDIAELYVDPTQRQRVLQLLEKFGEISGFEIHMRHRIGKEVWLAVYARSVLGPDGKVDYYDGFAVDVTEKREAEEALQERLSEIKELKGLLPICAQCKRIRDDKGYWNQIEVYLMEHADVSFSHSICRECAMQLYPRTDPDRLK
jgi:PAS domain S-box-containing protein